MNVQLSDDDALAIRLLALRLNLPAETIAQYAVRDFIARHSGA